MTTSAIPGQKRARIARVSFLVADLGAIGMLATGVYGWISDGRRVHMILVICAGLSLLGSVAQRLHARGRVRGR